LTFLHFLEAPSETIAPEKCKKVKVSPVPPGPRTEKSGHFGGRFFSVAGRIFFRPALATSPVKTFGSLAFR
jgi:hypothetical protein